MCFFCVISVPRRWGAQRNTPPLDWPSRRGGGHLCPLRLQSRPPKGPGAPPVGPWTPFFVVPFFFSPCFCCLPAGDSNPPLWTQGPEGEESALWPAPPLPCRHPRDLGTPGGSQGLLGSPGPLALLSFSSCFLFFWLSPAGDFAPLWTQGPEGGSRPIGPLPSPSCRYPRGTTTPGGSQGLLGPFGPLGGCFGVLWVAALCSCRRPYGPVRGHYGAGPPSSPLPRPLWGSPYDPLPRP